MTATPPKNSWYMSCSVCGEEATRCHGVACERHAHIASWMTEHCVGYATAMRDALDFLTTDPTPPQIEEWLKKRAEYAEECVAFQLAETQKRKKKSRELNDSLWVREKDGKRIRVVLDHGSNLFVRWQDNFRNVAWWVSRDRFTRLHRRIEET